MKKILQIPLDSTILKINLCRVLFVSFVFVLHISLYFIYFLGGRQGGDEAGCETFGLAF